MSAGGGWLVLLWSSTLSWPPESLCVSRWSLLPVSALRYKSHMKDVAGASSTCTGWGWSVRTCWLLCFPELSLRTPLIWALSKQYPQGQFTRSPRSFLYFHYGISQDCLVDGTFGPLLQIIFLQPWGILGLQISSKPTHPKFLSVLWLDEGEVPPLLVPHTALPTEQSDFSVSLASSSSAMGNTRHKAVTCSLLSSLAASSQTKLGCFGWCLFYFVGLFLFVWLVGLVWLGFLLEIIRMSRFEEKLDLLKRLKTQLYV